MAYRVELQDDHGRPWYAVYQRRWTWYLWPYWVCVNSWLPSREIADQWVRDQETAAGHHGRGADAPKGRE